MTAPDRGAPDPRLVAALAARDPEQIRDALAAARLLVAVVAVPGAEHASEGEMALALLESADGTQAVPAFTGLDALTGWSREARPVPRPASEVIAYALEQRMAVVLDPGSPHAWTLQPEERPASAREQGSGAEPARPAYAAPTWKPARKLRKAARHPVHRAYAVDGPSGPALAVVCPAGTLDAAWAEQLLGVAPAGTQLMLVPAADESGVRSVGVPLP